jgi:hypothetical protein
MASFRSAKAKASHALRPLVAHGAPRHAAKDDGKIHSLGTERGYTVALAGVQKWLDSIKGGDVKRISTGVAMDYLMQRAAVVSQKTLDLDRQALQAVTGAKLTRVSAHRTGGRLATVTRSYTTAQVKEIAAGQSDRYALATLIAHSAGLRAHELITILPAVERCASQHREWSSNRFAGREGQVYTVIGKGGLITEKILPPELAARLEARRLDVPQQVRDRGVNYQRHYDLAGGKKWSGDFSRASRDVLGYSTGGHGLRHAYAQERETELQSRGYTLSEARGIVAQEMGHFSSATTRSYER